MTGPILFSVMQYIVQSSRESMCTKSNPTFNTTYNALYNVHNIKYIYTASIMLSTVTPGSFIQKLIVSLVVNPSLCSYVNDMIDNKQVRVRKIIRNSYIHIIPYKQSLFRNKRRVFIFQKYGKFRSVCWGIKLKINHFFLKSDSHGCLYIYFTY